MLVSAMALLVTDIFAMDKSPMADQSSVSNATKKQKLKRVDSRARLPILKDKDQLPAPMSTEEYIDMLKKFLNENNQFIDPKELIRVLSVRFQKSDVVAQLELPKFHPNNDKQPPAFSKDLEKKMMTMQTDLIAEASKGLPDGMDFLEYEKSLNHKMNELQQIINEYQFEVNKYKLSMEEFEHFAEGTDQSLPSNRKILDVSCPSIIKYAKNQFLQKSFSFAEDPSDLPEDQLLQKEHLKWIINYFEPFVEKIQNHEIDPDDKYDSGLTDEDINLLIKLTVGANRVFGISSMSEAEKKKFHDEALTVMLQNATGFQRALSLLIMSIINSITQEQIWHLEVDFIKGEEGSSKNRGKVHINEADKVSLDTSLFHEITHSFHDMVAFQDFENELISNISIINARDLNLIDQYFPMLRPHVMNPILKEIESLIDKYFGHDFEKVTEEEKQKLTVVILEPIVRNAMMNGFGNFVFPDYEQNQSLKISVEMLTTKRMAICAYLSSILNNTELYPTYNKEDDSVNIPTNISEFKKIDIHPLFKKVKITPTQITVDPYGVFTSDSVWNDAEEKLTMQGNSALVIGKELYYIQDRQNEHIYLLRAHNVQTKASPIASHFRYHQIVKDRSSELKYVFYKIDELCSSLELGWGLKIFSMKEFYNLGEKIKKAFAPSMEEKYGLPGVEPVPYQEDSFHKAKKDQEQYETWLSALRNGREKAENKVKEKLEKEFDQKKVDQEIIYQKYLKLIPKTMTEEIQKQISILLKTKMDINSANENGETILFEAVRNYPKSVVQLFLNNGVDIFIKNNDDKNIMQIIINERFDDYKELIDLFISNGLKVDENLIIEVINSIDEDEIKQGKIAFLEQRGAQINARDLNGNTMLHNAIVNSSWDEIFIEQIIKYGANVNAKNNKGETPLYIASKQGVSPKIVNMLLENGASINYRAHNGETVLHCLIRRWCDVDHDDGNFKKLINSFIKKGLGINSIDKKGDTPLHTIARKDLESKNAINFLVEKGADPNIKNYDGKTPLELAKETQSPNAKFFEELANH